jgi:hypothetical protein
MLALAVSVLLFIVSEEALGRLEELLADFTWQSFYITAMTRHVEN